jgi:hypothetical protein
MNNKVFYGLILGISLTIGCTKEKDNADSTDIESNSMAATSEKPAKAKYDLASGSITFTMDEKEGPTIKKVYFEEYGKKEITELYRNGSMTEKLINTGDGYLYSLNYENNTAIKRKSSMNGTEQRFDVEEMPEDMKKENQVKRLPDEIVADKKCISFSLESGGIKTIKSGTGHIILYLRTDMGGIVKSFRATQIKENIKIPVEAYIVPEGFSIKEF